MQNSLLIFIHLIAVAIAIGSTFFSIFILLPELRKSESLNQPIEDSLELKIMDRLAPTVLGCVFALIITGVYFLLINYTNQVNLRPGYFNIFGLKILFVIVALGLSVYQTFSLRPRILDLDLRPENKKRLPDTLGFMQTLSQLNLWIISFASFFGIFLSRF